jgi:hypothetical protein
MTPVEEMIADLQLLNDVLATTPIGNRYWLFGGLLLGLAREGSVLGHDAVDADFAVLADDVGRLQASFDALFDAGFGPLYCFPGDGRPATEWSFTRGGRKFEFFVLDQVGDQFEYFNYALHGDRGPVFNRCQLPAQPLEEVAFLGRRWLKVRDHDLELTGNYGDWRTPDPAWDYLEGPSIVETGPWAVRSFGWTP